MSTQVVHALADAKDKEAVELPPLFEAVDPNALNAFFDYPGRRLGFTLTFQFAGHKVTITDDGEIVITVERLSKS